MGKSSIYSLQFWGDTTMHRQKLPIDHTGERDQIKGIHEEVINVLVILVQA